MMRRMSQSRTCIDRGGTFTDVVVLHDDGRVEVQKVPSDRAVVGRLAQGSLTFGTTVATNALLTRTGRPTLLLVSEGFADLVHIGDMTRPALFAPEERWPPSLATRVVEIGGRIAVDGQEVTPLKWPSTLDLRGIEAVAAVFLNSHRNAAHEEEAGRRLRALGAPLVSLGHAVSPEVGYLARIETTLVDAAITPVLRTAMDRDEIPDGARAVRSDGGLTPASALRAPDAVLSGPAGGVIAVEAIARAAGFCGAIGFDMGGTSTDVCVVGAAGLPRRTGDVRVAGVRLRRPMLEVDTIAAGGGSVVWSDGLRLGVGPDSAGADPGPQCYGRGGPPTLTDAALAAGLLDAGAFDPPLDAAAVDLPAEAEQLLDVARDQMAAAVRRLAAARGVDLRDHAIVAFGGAAGQHAAAVAARLGVQTVLFHPCASVLSALGQALARREEAAVAPLWVPLSAWAEVTQAWETLQARLPALGETVRSVDLRHTGTQEAIEVEAVSAAEARDRFLAAHQARYGFQRDAAVEIVNARVRVRGPAPDVRLAMEDAWGLPRPRPGPVRLDLPTTSVWVPAGWTARSVDGLLTLTRTEARPPPLPTTRTPHAVALWSSRFTAVATRAGEVLQRTAQSVNIRERLDFSCAVFDAQGGLVANAPHVPVHLGAMGATVRDWIRTVSSDEEGQHWLCNDPSAGGSHLPDLTVIHPVHHEGVRFFVACRGHHADVGGLTPGSMPARSHQLSDEGFVVRHAPLLRDGRIRDDLALTGSRQRATVLADLCAQIAANTTAARLLTALGPADRIATWMAHLADVADASLDAVLAGLPRRAIAEDVLVGLPLRVCLSASASGLTVDFTGTGGPDPGNTNAPQAVVRAGVLYALMVLSGREMPQNEGAMRRVRLVLPSPSVVCPPPDAAVAGGNVETSQRIVDLVLRAAGWMAGSAGSMSNLTIGGAGWSLYETIGAGQGATPRGPGLSGRQIHMTNTRATDPEVLEERLPVRLIRFALRRHSGGAGQHDGGDGLVREVEVRAPSCASLLATRRTRGAPGLGTGSPGLPGVDQVRRNDIWAPWDGDAVDLSRGDRVRVFTPGGGGWG